MAYLETWFLGLCVFLLEQIKKGKHVVEEGKKRPSVKQAPPEYNPKLIDDELEKFPRVRQLHELMRKWMDLPDIKPTLTDQTKIELIKQLSLYKRGSVARCANKKKGGKLKKLEQEEAKMHDATTKAEEIKTKLGLAQNLIGHCEANSEMEARTRHMIRSRHRKQFDKGAPLATLADDAFDDLLDLSQPFQEDQSQTKSFA